MLLTRKGKFAAFEKKQRELHTNFSPCKCGFGMFLVKIIKNNEPDDRIELHCGKCRDVTTLFLMAGPPLGSRLVI